mmetsp:Transcript_64735/g.140551  ORF Transcript_64735/g.140551 Transcript_64735/m.140551 type:complete len:82 (-) Transcript_64735:182-427(-)
MPLKKAARAPTEQLQRQEHTESYGMTAMLVEERQQVGEEPLAQRGQHESDATFLFFGVIHLVRRLCDAESTSQVCVCCCLR